MSLIFDRFPDIEAAQAFRQAVMQRFPGRATHVWMDQDEMHRHFDRTCLSPSGPPPAIPEASPAELEIESDYFPFRLDPPIVVVGRSDSYDEERQIEALVVRFGGVFAGT